MTEERENTKEFRIPWDSESAIHDAHLFITTSIWEYWKYYGSANMKITIEFHRDDEVVEND